jgi:putative sterol carrier protein
VFKIDGEQWTLDLREGKGSLAKGSPSEGDKVDITLTMTADTFVKLVMGKLGSQQAFLMRKLKINGSMALAMKLQPVLEAAQPQAKM